ncbi:unnamed protein product [Mycena citricolor]|uniref:Mitochondrial import inner membrane translocase subunit Tim21 n=1 Tax=Mycena citricolor TaxID=2018698 RepID=A0AAD2Q1D1_9AGAR|nr:unnamed protein product [Mycena citricolor]
MSFRVVNFCGRLSCRRQLLTGWRNYSTHKTSSAARPSILSQSLDQNSSSQDKGPFQLGLGLGQPARSAEKPPPKWSELSTAGKVSVVKRTTARTTNLTVIVVGAGLSAVLIYCLTSELFSKNSPSVLYDDACERIKSSPRLAKHLDGVPRFHVDPPIAGVRPRHRNRHVNSAIRVDATGREHMFLNFYLQAEPQKPSFSESLSIWAEDKLSRVPEMNAEEILSAGQDWAVRVWDRCKDAFKFLSGTESPLTPSSNIWTVENKAEKTDDQPSGGFMGMFSSLRRSRGGGTEPVLQQKTDTRTFNEGEVHVNFVKNNHDEFVLRYIIVELPNSRSRNPLRVFVERTPGVRDNEPVLRWNS